MSELLTPEGSLALAIGVLELVLGYRFTLPERGRDLGGVMTFAAAVVVGFAAGRGLVPAAPVWPAPLLLRAAGDVLLLAGLFLAGASYKVRLRAGRDQLATGGPYAWVRHPLYLGLSIVLVGGLLHAPTSLSLVATAIAVAHYTWLGAREERAAREKFGEAWREYAGRTGAVIPTRSKA